MTLQNLGNIGDLLAGTAAIIAVFIAFFQLRNAGMQLLNLNKNLISNNLLTIFEIEFELNRRKERLSEIRKDNQEFMLKLKEKEITDDDKKLLKTFDNYRKEAYENYLNVFDRLCYFVIKKKLDEDDFRLEYRHMLFNTIESDKEGTFNIGSKFRNMNNLYNSWKEK